MKKRIIIAVLVAVVLVSSVAIYFATKSDVVIGIAKPVDLSTQMYTEQIILSFGKELSDKQGQLCLMCGYRKNKRILNSKTRLYTK